MAVADPEKFEEKLRDAEKRLGVSEGDNIDHCMIEREVADDNFVYCTFLGVSITYDRNGDITGRLLVLLILFALFMTLMSRVRGIKSPISMDTFVSKTNSMVYYVNIESL